MVTPLVSVIVPVYNSQLFLKQCVESITRQTLQEIEIIFVDDGSTDKSLEILIEYQKKDDRIKVIKQKNQFAGVARNNGMKHATGKYLIFLDADDFFEKNLLKDCYQCAEKYQSEVVMFGAYRYDNESRETTDYYMPPKVSGLFDPNIWGNKIIQNASATPWNKFLLRNFVISNNLEYQDVHNDNDEYFNRMVILCAKRIVSLQNRYVFYRVNNKNSLQGGKKNNTNYEYAICMFKVLYKLKYELTLREMLNGDIKKSFSEYASTVILRKLLNCDLDDSVRNLLYQDIKTNLIPNVFDSVNDLPEHMQFLCNSVSISEFLCIEYSKLQRQMDKLKRTEEYRKHRFLHKIFRIVRH